MKWKGKWKRLELIETKLDRSLLCSHSIPPIKFPLHSPMKIDPNAVEKEFVKLSQYFVKSKAISSSNVFIPFESEVISDHVRIDSVISILFGAFSAVVLVESSVCSTVCHEFLLEALKRGVRSEDLIRIVISALKLIAKDCRLQARSIVLATFSKHRFLAFALKEALCRAGLLEEGQLVELELKTFHSPVAAAKVNQKLFQSHLLSSKNFALSAEFIDSVLTADDSMQMRFSMLQSFVAHAFSALKEPLTAFYLLVKQFPFFSSTNAEYCAMVRSIFASGELAAGQGVWNELALVKVELALGKWNAFQSRFIGSHRPFSPFSAELLVEFCRFFQEELKQSLQKQHLSADIHHLNCLLTKETAFFFPKDSISSLIDYKQATDTLKKALFSAQKPDFLLDLIDSLCEKMPFPTKISEYELFGFILKNGHSDTILYYVLSINAMILRRFKDNSSAVAYSTHFVESFDYCKFLGQLNDYRVMKLVALFWPDILGIRFCCAQIHSQFVACSLDDIFANDKNYPLDQCWSTYKRLHPITCYSQACERLTLRQFKGISIADAPVILASSVCIERLKEKPLLVFILIECLSALICRAFSQIDEMQEKIDLELITAFKDLLHCTVINSLLNLAKECQSQASIVHQVTEYIHQISLKIPKLLSLIHLQGYSPDLLPLMIRFVPSMHILFEEFEQIQPFNPTFASSLFPQLAQKYPIKKAEECCRTILESHMNIISCSKDQHALSIDKIKEQITVLMSIFTAFPHLKREIMEILRRILHKLSPILQYSKKRAHSKHLSKRIRLYAQLEQSILDSVKSIL